MSGLSQLFAVFERIPADELRLTTGENPYVISGGEKRFIAATPMTTQLILGAAGEVLSNDEIADLPLARPRVVRHEHAGETWVVEVGRVTKGFMLVVRRGQSIGVVSRLEPRRSSEQSATAAEGVHGLVTETVSNAVGAGIVASSSSFAPSSHAGRPRERESSTMPRVSVSGSSDRKRIDDLLRAMIASRASDLHLASSNPPVMRVDGEIHFAEDTPALSSSEIDSMMRAIMGPKTAAEFSDLRDADFAYELAGLARFRVNVFEDRKGIGAVVRQIPIEIKTVEQLGLPKACLDLCQLSKGLVLVTGPTGSGKSTTLAAMIDHINKTRSEHIITIEDPVEFVHPNQRCLVNQREVGQHTRSFKNALRAALREDPDVVLVGELRDLETIAIAIETAETGHLVFGTLHTTTAVSTVDRIVDQFPTDRQSQIRVMLSESLKGVVAQSLCKRIGGGRVAAHEILLGMPSVGALIRDGKTFQLQSVMQTSKAQGMVTMNDSLLSLVQRKLVAPSEAYLEAVDKAGLTSMFKSNGIPFAI